MDCANGDQVTRICVRKSCKLLKFQGSELLHALGVETHGLDPELYFVPWILFNGVRIPSKNDTFLFHPVKVKL